MYQMCIRDRDYIEVCEEAANKLKNELKAEEKRVSRYLILISQNTNKPATMQEI